MLHIFFTQIFKARFVFRKQYDISRINCTGPDGTSLYQSVNLISFSNPKQSVAVKTNVCLSAETIAIYRQKQDSLWIAFLSLLLSSPKIHIRFSCKMNDTCAVTCYYLNHRITVLMGVNFVVIVVNNLIVNGVAPICISTMGSSEIRYVAIKVLTCLSAPFGVSSVVIKTRYIKASLI